MEIRRRSLCGAIGAAALLPRLALAQTGNGRPDEFSWLEDERSERTRAWVAGQNARVQDSLVQDPLFAELKAALAVPGPAPDQTMRHVDFSWIRRGYLYQNIGVIRRAQLDSFLEGRPQWQTIFDPKDHPALFLPGERLMAAIFSPTGKSFIQMITGSSIFRRKFIEIDSDTGRIVENGFHVPAPRGGALVWTSDDEIAVCADVTPGATESAQGRPSLIRRWRRGKPFAEASIIFQAQPDHTGVYLGWVGDMAMGPASPELAGDFTFAERGADGSLRSHLVRASGKIERLPPAADLLAYQGRYANRLVYLALENVVIGSNAVPPGTLVTIAIEGNGPVERAEARIIFCPSDGEIVDRVSISAKGLLLSGNRAGASALWTAVPRSSSGWKIESVALPMTGVLGSQTLDARTGLFVSSLETSDCPRVACSGSIVDNRVALIGSAHAAASPGDIVTELLWAAASDGKQVPYFLIRLKPDDTASTIPVIINSYPMGGANVPSYKPEELALWIRRGGAYVLSNGRGGDVLGRVTGLNIRHCYGDVIAIAEDLVARDVTRPRKIGFLGHSAGGWLAGVLFNRRPDLFGAVAMMHPLSDAFRLEMTVGLGRAFYGPKGEFFGDYAVPEIRKLNEANSPQQNLRKRSENPVPLIITGTKDENVKAALVRRYAAKMETLGMPFYFREYPDGDHFTDGGLGEMTPLIFTYFHRQLMGPTRSAVPKA